MIGLLPAIVDSIDRDPRIVKVRIPGLTDGATDLPRAQLCNPLGDNSEETEIRIKPGDDVWLAFEGGDPRYPVIVGYRPKNEGNGIDWRRFGQANFEFNADQEFVINAGVKVTIKAQTAIVQASEQATIETPKVLIDADEATCTGKLTVQGELVYQSGMTGEGGASIDGDLTNNGKNVGSEHVHDRTKPGNPGERSGTPI